ncbi:hypothetical protein, partial [Salmonella sp. s51228]|uniref:hypothetical protein n=1 Tax=Salmonella sp. s51228 TaxID=3159652 RepID=UPI00397EF12D
MAEASPNNNNKTCESTIIYSNVTKRSPSVTIPPRLYINIADSQLPIVYCTNYDISFFGLQKLHPFDTQKWGRIHQFLINDNLIHSGQSVIPLQITDAELLTHHTPEYLNSLRYSSQLAAIAEVAPIAFIPNFLLQRSLLNP